MEKGERTGSFSGPARDAQLESGQEFLDLLLTYLPLEPANVFPVCFLMSYLNH